MPAESPTIADLARQLNSLAQRRFRDRGGPLDGSSPVPQLVRQVLLVAFHQLAQEPPKARRNRTAPPLEESLHRYACRLSQRIAKVPQMGGR